MKRATILPTVGLLAFVSVMALAAPKSITITIERNMSCKDGSTNGRLLISDKQVARTLEPALEGNRIPIGEYSGTIRTDGKLGWRIELKDVPGWTEIEIHKGNYPSNTRGCVLVGTDVVPETDPNTGRETCKVHDSATALADVRAAMETASDNGVSSQGLSIKVVVK